MTQNSQRDRPAVAAAPAGPSDAALVPVAEATASLAAALPASPLIAQRQMVEIGRIRTGDRVQSKTGTMIPHRLERFRMTSPSKRVIEAVAVRYGGEVIPWADAPAGPQWQVYIEADEIEVVITALPRATSFLFELWSGGGCKRRCDGMTEMLTDEGCLCLTEGGERKCKPTTRLLVALAGVPGLGVWRLQSGGWNFAAELPFNFDLLRAVSIVRNVGVKATLRIEQRADVKDGKTRKYPVPVLDSTEALDELLMIPGVPGTLAAMQANAQAVQLAPVYGDRPALPAAPAPIQHTDADEDTGRPTMPPWQRFAMLCSEGGFSDDERHALCEEVSGGKVSSSKELSPEQLETATAMLRQQVLGAARIAMRVLELEPAAAWEATRNEASTAGIDLPVLWGNCEIKHLAAAKAAAERILAAREAAAVPNGQEESPTW